MAAQKTVGIFWYGGAHFRKFAYCFALLSVVSCLISQCTVVEPSPNVVVLTSNQVRVEESETLEMVAYRYGVFPRALAEINRLTAPYSLCKGQILTLPTKDGAYYEKKPSEQDPPLSDQPTLLKDGEAVAGPEDQGLDGKGVPQDSDDVLPQEMQGHVDDVPGARESDNPATEKDLNWEKDSKNARVSQQGLPRSESRVPESTSAKGKKDSDGLALPIQSHHIEKSKSNSLTVLTDKSSVVRAAAGGRVKYVGQGIKSSGNIAIVEMPGKKNFVLVYGLLKNLRVKEGDVVSLGQPLGDLEADKGKWALCFELWDWDSRKLVDPMPFLSKSFKSLVRTGDKGIHKSLKKSKKKKRR
jgi:murein DD-endopeptidase MepM/ murein hydrolase activator NlpD